MLCQEMMPQIKGLQKTTLIDYPGKIACTIFLAGCNFRCGYCHNKDLVCTPQSLPSIPAEELLEFLSKRKNVLEGVCITGGEPTLHGQTLINLCAQIKERGYSIKLDTNGTTPLLLRQLIKGRLIDYIAMDIKNPLESYHEVVGVRAPIHLIQESIELIKSCGIDYEFRTTIVPDLMTEANMKKIGELIKGAKQYSIQQFYSSEHAIEPVYASMEPQSFEQLERYKRIMQEYVPLVSIKNAY